MRYIRKNPAPPAFEDWKNANNPSDWGDLQNEPPQREEGIVYYAKNALREALLREQGHLCCYCQQRIENVESTVIEHLYPRNGADKVQGKAKMFVYENLMASCDGGSIANRDRQSTTPSYPQFCDKSKGEKVLLLSPLQPDVETRLTYLRIDTEALIAPINVDPAAASTIGEDILNLNTPFLKKRRGEAVVGLIFKDEEMLEPISPKEAEQILSVFVNLENEQNDRLPEFLTAKLCFLRQFSQGL